MKLITIKIWLLECKSISLIALFFALRLVLQLVFQLTGATLDNGSVGQIQHDFGFIISLITTLFFAPVVEVLIFQVLIIGIGQVFLSKIISGKVSTLISLSLSAVLFSLNHFYTIPYLLVSLVSGYIYGLLYIIAKKRIRNAFLYPLILHFLWNLTAFSYNIITKFSY